MPYQHHPSVSWRPGRPLQHMWWAIRPLSHQQQCKTGLCLGTYSGLFFTAVLQDATSRLKAGVFLQMRTDGGLLNLARLRAKWKVRDIVVHEIQFADDYHWSPTCLKIYRRSPAISPVQLKTLDWLLAWKRQKSCTSWPWLKLCRNNCPYWWHSFQSSHLGSIMSSSASLDLEVEARTRIASFAFGQLKDCIWSQNIRLATKYKVNRAVVISALLYRCEVWFPYQRHLCQIDQLQQHHLCSLMKITWWDKVPNTEVQPLQNALFKPYWVKGTIIILWDG